MEAVIFIGLQASGKSSFYKERFFRTHVRISLDLLRTRHRERLFLEACLTTEQRFVIDNTNPTRTERAKYIERTRAARVRHTISGYCFESSTEDCLRRNAARAEIERIPEVGILSTAQRFERPEWDEGFDRMFSIRLQNGQFIVEEWQQ